MKSFKHQTKSFNDENSRIKSKNSTSTKLIGKATTNDNNNNPSSNDRREVLGDLTQLNENRKIDLNLKNSLHKIQAYKQRQQHQKRPLEVVARRNELEPQGLEQHNYETSQQSDDILKSHFERLGGSSEVSNIDEVGLELERNEHRIVEQFDDDEEDEEEEEEGEEEDEDYNKPMEPKWNKVIFNELQYVMKKFSRTTLDENDEDTFDVTMVAEYSPEIFNYLHELEYRLVPDANYMNNQDELKWEMRSVLIDWVVQVHNRFNLLPETLFLTVNYIDRFLSKRKVSLSRFQLVGAVALFIAAKYEEINCPTVQEVAYMADNAYSVDDFLKAERFMIDVLEFDMGWPGPMSFLRRTSKADDYDYETRTLAKYFLEITIMDSRFVASQPSWLAAGAHYLSRKLLNRGLWTEAHVFYSGYTESQLRPLAEILLQNCRSAESNHKAIFEKYQERRYRRSSAFVQEYFEALEQ